ncbi:hypothetical protein AVEN_70198-1 [Araneus ventricosus]|uniref:Uncharacterized protein n=1 Tax=Araneus ventricosus TaxID=182803 RepID=A0A4Y2FCT7_ARAVE|nr:hypothetical protein AVEN_70198-1 [Araneus ventricosus]
MGYARVGRFRIGTQSMFPREFPGHHVKVNVYKDVGLGELLQRISDRISHRAVLEAVMSREKNLLRCLSKDCQICTIKKEGEAEQRVADTCRGISGIRHGKAIAGPISVRDRARLPIRPNARHLQPG